MKKLILLCMMLLLALPVTVNAAGKFNEKIMPATETTVNGIPESQIVHTNDVLVGPFFYSYDPNYHTTINEFKKIAGYSHDNSRNATTFPMTVTITSSTTQGSEWGGNVTFSGEIKAGIFGGVKQEYGGNWKETRQTNEAVGIQGGPLMVPAYKWGYIDMYYKAQASGGNLTTYTYNTADPNTKYYSSTLINAKFYNSDFVDVHSKAWTS